MRVGDLRSYFKEPLTAFVAPLRGSIKACIFFQKTQTLGNISLGKFIKLKKIQNISLVVLKTYKGVIQKSQDLN
jgi:hypothetical protein